MSKEIAKRVFYDGRVQGVGFRITTKRIAREYEVTGFVRNLSDGRVELVVQGNFNEVEGFIDNIRKSELAGNIRKETVEDISVEDRQQFIIR